MNKAAKADTLGGRMRMVRELNGLKQKEVAEYLHVDTNTYGNYERNEREPKIDMLSRFCDVMDISLDDVAGRHTAHGKSVLEALHEHLMSSCMLCEQELETQRGQAR